MTKLWHYRLCPQAILFLSLVVIGAYGCKKEDCTCKSSPSFYAHVRPVNHTDTDRFYVLVQDTATREITDSMYLGNRVELVFYILESGQTESAYRFIFNEKDALYKGKHLAAFNYIFINENKGLKDTISHIYWDERKSPTHCRTPEGKECKNKVNVSLAYKNQTYYPLKDNFYVW